MANIADHICHKRLFHYMKGMWVVDEMVNSPSSVNCSIAVFSNWDKHYLRVLGIHERPPVVLVLIILLVPRVDIKPTYTKFTHEWFESSLFLN